eukprot:gnl/MRDRNA2_/MRDRNA2_189776_c0_seq1.p1 gnl/MRDRNA2_/MRDRNA2_189776_c0~~gnl/MRDRNA2_/MRDRNA2_189776_c0_seq1.p1  ORF type:complete len:297 (+),score=65.50 gnl/MRDRNA2_/MRDRNA2_189776_c0_seq1:1-891(+)
MLLAIIMDCHTQVTGASRNTETVPEQMLTLYLRWKETRSGIRLPLQTIDRKLSEVYGETNESDLEFLSVQTQWRPGDIITIKGFAAVIDGMKEKQADRLVKLAVRKWRIENADALTLTEAMAVIDESHRHLLQQQSMLTNLETVTEKTGEKSDAKLDKLASTLEGVEQRLAQAEAKLSHTAETHLILKEVSSAQVAMSQQIQALASEVRGHSMIQTQILQELKSMRELQNQHTQQLQQCPKAKAADAKVIPQEFRATEPVAAGPPASWCAGTAHNKEEKKEKIPETKIGSEEEVLS